MNTQPGLHVHLDTHPERLLDRLAEALAFEARALPLGTPQIVAVGAQGMARWLEQELARRHGICAGIEFPFPAKLVQRALDEVAPREAKARAAVSREGLRWRIAVLLAEIARAESAEAVDGVWWDLGKLLRTGGVPDDGRIFEVAAAAARALDALELHRPDQWMDPSFAAGRASPHAGWLLALRERIPELADNGFAALRRQMLNSEAPIVLDAAWPRNVHLFGLSTVPAAWLEILHAFGRRSGRSIHLYRTVPTLHWLADQTRRALIRGEEGLQPFVARQVQAARRMQQMLFELDERHGFVEDEGRFDDEGPADSLLASLQSSWRGLSAMPAGKVAADDSLRLHTVHHPQREMEILRDELWKAIEELPGLRPRDILVLLPDIEAWAPWIRAVFQDSELPWSIADRQARNALPGVEAWFALVETLAGRLPAGAVARLLDLEAWQRVFGLEGVDHARMRSWIKDAAARWGLDAADRQRLLAAAGGQVSTLEADFSWRFALDRMILGWLHGRGGSDVLGEFDGPRAPLTEVADDASTFAGLLTFLDWLAGLRAQASVPRPIGRGGEGMSWSELLTVPLRRLQAVVDDDDTQTLRQLAETLERLEEAATVAGWDAPVELDVFRRLVVDAWDEASPRSKFLDGGVTFAALAPMRGVPFRMIALCGFSEGAWPRPKPTGEFDLLAADDGDDGLHALGDPDRRAEDRLAFFEAVLAARERLHVSWIGRDSRDGRPLPPALVVGELLDEIERHLGRAPTIHEHPVHAFAADRDRPSSVAPVSSPATARAASALRSPTRLSAAPFWDGVADRDALASPLLTVDELGRFWQSPARAWLRTQGIFVEEAEGSMPEDDPVALDRSGESRLVERLLWGPVTTAAAAMARLRGEAMLPPGRMGRALFEQVWSRVSEVRGLLPEGWGDRERIGALGIDLVVSLDKWLDEVGAHLAPELRAALERLGPARVRGRIGGWDPEHSSLWSVAMAKVEEHYVRWPVTWQLALARCAVGPSVKARVVALDATPQAGLWRLDDPGEDLVPWLVAGALLGRAAPLAWESKIACAFADAPAKEPAKALGAARKAAGFGDGDRQKSGARRFDLIQRIWGWADSGEDEEMAGDAVWARYISKDGPLPPAESWWRSLAPPRLQAGGKEVDDGLAGEDTP